MSRCCSTPYPNGTVSYPTQPSIYRLISHTSLVLKPGTHAPAKVVSRHFSTLYQAALQAVPYTAFHLSSHFTHLPHFTHSPHFTHFSGAQTRHARTCQSGDQAFQHAVPSGTASCTLHSFPFIVSFHTLASFRTLASFHTLHTELARTIYIQCIYGVLGRDFIKYPVICGVYTYTVLANPTHTPLMLNPGTHAPANVVSRHCSTPSPNGNAS